MRQIVRGPSFVRRALLVASRLLLLLAAISTSLSSLSWLASASLRTHLPRCLIPTAPAPTLLLLAGKSQLSGPTPTTASSFAFLVSRGLAWAMAAVSPCLYLPSLLPRSRQCAPRVAQRLHQLSKTGINVYVPSPLIVYGYLIHVVGHGIQIRETHSVIVALLECSGFAWENKKGANIGIENEGVWADYVKVRVISLLRSILPSVYADLCVFVCI